MLFGGLPRRHFPHSVRESCRLGGSTCLSNTQTPHHAKLKSETVGSAGRQLTKTTLNNGYLGSRIDEERSEMRYVV